MPTARASAGGLLRLALLVLCLAFAARARAACEVGPDTAMLAVEGIGAAYFREVSTDTAADRVEFFGGVCVEGEGGFWTVEAEQIVVSGLRGGLHLNAEPATLVIEGWRLEAAALQATPERLDLVRPRLEGPSLSGSSASATVNLVTGEVRLQDLMMRYPSLVARGREARLVGADLILTDPMITSCTCPGMPFYSVQGSRGTVTIDGKSLLLEGGELHIGGLTFGLEDPLELTAEKLAELTLPLAVAYVPDTKGKKGTGLGVVVEPLPIAPGVDGTFGATGLDMQYPLRPVAVLHGKTPTAEVSVGKRTGGLAFEVETNHALTPWLDAGFDVRLMGPELRDGLKEGVLHLRADTPVPSVRGRVGAEVFAAASAQEPDSGPVAGARLGVAVNATAATATTPAGRLSVHAGAELTGYPDQTPGALQWGVRLAPAWRYTTGPLTVQLGYQARFTNAGSPFSAELDRLTPRQRVNAVTRVTGAIAPGWSGSFEVRGAYDLVPFEDLDVGLNGLSVNAALARELPGWTLRAGVDSQLAGVVAPDGQRDGRVTASITATQDVRPGYAALEFGTRARFLVAPDPVGLDLLELNAAVPIQLPGVELRPYLAVDLVPTLLRSELPAISGHGLTATFETCCGAFTIGYRNQENVWSASFAIDLERRPSAAEAQAAEARCAATSAVAGTPEGAEGAVPGALPGSAAAAAPRTTGAAPAATCQEPLQHDPGIMRAGAGG